MRRELSVISIEMRFVQELKQGPKPYALRILNTKSMNLLTFYIPNPWENPYTLRFLV